MASKQPPSFDAKTFLAKFEHGKTLRRYKAKDVLFSQGDAADAVFYIQEGRVKLTVFSSKGKEAVVAILEQKSFVGEGCLAGQPLRLAAATALDASKSSASIRHR
jgi:CRP-like cAMP-binding protein